MFGSFFSFIYLFLLDGILNVWSGEVLHLSLHSNNSGQAATWATNPKDEPGWKVGPNTTRSRHITYKVWTIIWLSLIIMKWNPKKNLWIVLVNSADVRPSHRSIHVSLAKETSFLPLVVDAYRARPTYLPNWEADLLP